MMFTESQRVKVTRDDTAGMCMEHGTVIRQSKLSPDLYLVEFDRQHELGQTMKIEGCRDRSRTLWVTGRMLEPE